MLRFQWSREALSYLRANQGLVNELELAFATYRERGTRLPEEGVVDTLAPLAYIWGIHEHIVLFRHILDGSQWIIRVEVIKPVRSLEDDLFLGE